MKKLPIIAAILIVLLVTLPLVVSAAGNSGADRNLAELKVVPYPSSPEGDLDAKQADVNTAAPVVGAFWLLGFSLLVLLGIRRKRR